MQSNENADSVYLAVDLGASSGRVIAGLLREGKLELNVIHRFENSPVRVHQSLQWDVLGLWKEIQQGLRMASAEHPHIESVGVILGVWTTCLLMAQTKLNGGFAMLSRPTNPRNDRMGI